MLQEAAAAGRTGDAACAKRVVWCEATEGLSCILDDKNSVKFANTPDTKENRL